jgi:hypothetical protein
MLKTSDDENEEMCKLDIPKYGKALYISEVINWMERHSDLSTSFAFATH